METAEVFEMKMKQETDRTRAERYTKHSWSRLILKKYPTCCRCKDAKSVDPAHIYGKGIAPELALHPLNGLGLCRKCHKICDHGPDRDEIYRVARSILGQKKFDELSEARYKPAVSLEEREKELLSQLK